MKAEEFIKQLEAERDQWKHLYFEQAEGRAQSRVDHAVQEARNASKQHNMALHDRAVAIDEARNAQRESDRVKRVNQRLRRQIKELKLKLKFLLNQEEK